MGFSLSIIYLLTPSYDLSISLHSGIELCQQCADLKNQLNLLNLTVDKAAEMMQDDCMREQSAKEVWKKKLEDSDAALAERKNAKENKKQSGRAEGHPSTKKIFKRIFNKKH